MDSSSKPDRFLAHDLWYSSVLEEATDGEHADRLLYTYLHVSQGFAARLTEEEVAKVRTAHGCLGAFEDSVYHLHTTYTPRFMGLNPWQGLWHDSHFADGIIIGVLDSGVWPESASFNDVGLGPVPAKWRGRCQTGPDFNSSNCNRKLIGASFFGSGHDAAASAGEGSELPLNRIGSAADVSSPRDTAGHGTHTASTAGGALVADASFLGYARGDAQGLASRARVAVYKVCWSRGCYATDILKAMDTAVKDQVDVLSLSIGSNGVPPFYMDPIAKGAFQAMQKGVFVSCSAGNSGPTPSTVVNAAPWIATVGASTIDRDFPAMAVLGDGTLVRGASLYQQTLQAGGHKGRSRKRKNPPGASSAAMLPMVFGRSEEARSCFKAELDPKLVKGKVVVCERGMTGRVEKGMAVKEAGGAAMILLNQASNGEELIADAHVLPALLVGAKAAATIKAYLNSAKNPTAYVQVFGTTLIGDRSEKAPSVAAFSSRGPNAEAPQILKPDVVAPGVNVLASWSRAVGFSGEGDPRRGDFNIISGTSMSCPHVSGLVALIKAIHPDWSVSAIKSALMTTAFQADNNHPGEPIRDTVDESVATPFAMGAGHISPNKAVDPGLVYDADTSDYTKFICSIKYTDQQISLLLGSNATGGCSTIGSFSSPTDLNYPSISFVIGDNSTGGAGANGTMVMATQRTVTNVGRGKGPWYYTVTVNSPPHVQIGVSPTQLQFLQVNEKATFRITIEASTQLGERRGRQEFGSITWSSMGTPDAYVVRSPVAVTWK
ncbi:subtilisin-like protease SBT1.8 [Nymphaea colorata]|uniref:subtilisin-like protease SBT1.8 n=1 Tax=Nymphaea colorata TaxID=210225 RepID=UPI00129EA2BA|nr:subtilisin-like protease SBT1.8 [Nymphaea colorata]